MCMCNNWYFMKWTSCLCKYTDVSICFHGIGDVMEIICLVRIAVCDRLPINSTDDLMSIRLGDRLCPLHSPLISFLHM